MLAPSVLHRRVMHYRAVTLRLHEYEVCPDSLLIQFGNLLPEKISVAELNLCPKSDFRL